MSVDMSENQAQTNTYHCGNASGDKTNPPKEPAKHYPAPKVAVVTNGLPGCQFFALNTALQDLITLREAAIEHAKQRSCDFSLIIKKLGTDIDATQHVHLDRLTTFEKLEEAKALVDAKNYYMENLLAEIESTYPLLNSRRGQKENGYKKPSAVDDHLAARGAGGRRDKLQLVSNDQKELGLQKKEFEDRIKTLEAEMQELHLQKKGFGGQIQKVEVTRLELKVQQNESEYQVEKLKAMNLGLHLQKIKSDGQIRRLEAENLDLCQQKREYLLQQSPREAFEDRI